VRERAYRLAAVCLALLLPAALPAQEPNLRATLGTTRDTVGVQSVAFSPDGKLLAAGDSEGLVRLWEVATARQNAILKGHKDKVMAVAFSVDGKLLASGGDDKTVRLWDVATGKEKCVLKGHQNTVGFVAFSPDGKTLASSSWDYRVRLWDLASGKEKAVLGGDRGWCYPVLFRRDGKLMIAGSEQVELWDVEKRKEQKFALKQKEYLGRWAAVALSPDGKRLAGGSALSSQLWLWDVQTGSLEASLDWNLRGIEPTSLAFSPDGKLLAGGDQGRVVKLWGVAPGKRERPDGVDHGTTVLSLAFSPDGKLLASGGWDRVVRLWEMPPPRKQDK
jgi:WD40 repeat protein